MGREAEVVAELLPAFDARHPDIQVRVQQLPWTAAHEKLLTAYAGDALPDLCQLGNTWLPEFSALDALEPLDARVAASRHRRARLLRRHPRHQRDADGEAPRLLGLPWYVDTRLLFYRSDLLRAAGHAQPPQTWAEWRAAMRASGGAAAARTYGALLPLNEPDPLFALALQQADRLLRRRRHAAARSRSPRSAARSTSTPASSATAWRRAMATTQIANVWDEFARGLFAFYVTGPGTSASSGVACPPSGRATGRPRRLPGPDGPGVSTAGGSSLVMFKRLAAQGRGLAADRVPERARDACSASTR